MSANARWIAPSNIVAALQGAHDQLQRLAATRPDMAPLVNQHLENLKAAIQFLEEYTKACRRGEQQSPAGIHILTVSPADAASFCRLHRLD